MSVISYKCAWWIKIDNLIDERFAGLAVGVGQSRVLGRIHMVDMHVGEHVIKCNLIVTEDLPEDFLLGLDNM